MSNKQKQIKNLLSKLIGVDKKICSLSERLEYVRKVVNEQCENAEMIADDDEEECPDVADSEKALVEAIERLYVEELLTREPEGDA